MQCIVYCFGYMVFFFVEFGIYDGYIVVFENCFYICKVQVDCILYGDNFGYVFGCD